MLKTMMITVSVKMLAIPSAKHRIMDRIPSLEELRVSYPSCVLLLSDIWLDVCERSITRVSRRLLDGHGAGGRHLEGREPARAQRTIARKYLCLMSAFEPSKGAPRDGLTEVSRRKFLLERHGDGNCEVKAETTGVSGMWMYSWARR